MNVATRKLLLLVGAVVFVDSVFFAALTPLLPELADRLDLSNPSTFLQLAPLELRRINLPWRALES